MPRSQGVNPNPNNTEREIGLYSNSLTYRGVSTGRGGGTPQNVTTTKDYRLFANYQNGSAELKVGPSGLERTVATRSANGRWQVTQDAGSTDAERKALQNSLNAGQFGKKLNNELKEVAIRDLGNDQYSRRFNPSIAQTSEQESTSGGGADGAGGNSGGSSLRDNEGNIKNSISNKIEARTKYASSDELRYPIAYSGNDFMQIEMLRYVPEKNLSLGQSPDATGDDAKSLALGNLRRPSERQEKEASIATITLPIPSNLIDTNLVNWKNDDLDAIKGYFAGSATRVMGSGSDIGNQLGREVRGLGNIASKQGDALKSIITAGIVRQLLDVPTILTRSTGAVLNQNTELLFDGPGLRSFSFSFKMTPRDQRESIAVKKIIRTLKQGMAVKRAVDGLFLSTPNIFRITFYYSTQDGNPKKHPFLPTLKLCALQNMSVNYMPDGSYMTYGDGSMVAYDMTLNFGEIEPIFDTDYDELDGVDSKGNPTNPDSVIGY